MTLRLFLPTVHGNQAAIEEETDPFFWNPNAALAALAWKDLQGVNAKRIVFDVRLNRAAQKHAEYLNSRSEADIAARAGVKNASHYGLLWELANQRVLDEGYELPDYFHPDKNNVESIARDGRKPEIVVVELAAHDTHEAHMLGQGSFALQTVFGVGVAGSDYVFLRCPPEE